MKRFTRALAIILCIVLAATTVLAQSQLGGVSLHHFEARAIRSFSVRTSAGLAAIGGVAFLAVAVPAQPSDATFTSVDYDSAQPDGQRATVAMRDGTTRAIPLYDWEMVPIVRYVDGGNSNCITAFGDLVNEADRQAAAGLGRGYVVNYNPALKDTLLGMRLWQADVMLMLPDAADLPTGASGAYLLGLGEAVPDLARNQAGWSALLGTVENTAIHYRSYVLTDLDRRVEFDTSTGSVRVGGLPYYRFWRYKSEGDDHTGAERADAMTILTSIEKMSSRQAMAWLAAQINSTRAALRSYLQRDSALDLAKMDLTSRVVSLAYNRIELRAVQSGVEHVDVLDDAVTPRLLAGANPTIYSAAVQTMRYAAFFRYVRGAKPSAWRSLIAKVRGVVVSPAVQTPTYFVPSRSGSASPAPAAGAAAGAGDSSAASAAP